MNGYEAMRDWYKGRIAALEAENAALLLDRNELLAHYQRSTAEALALREDKARLVEALERICTHSRDADCGDHCSNACMYCQGRAAIDAARKEEREQEKGD